MGPGDTSGTRGVCDLWPVWLAGARCRMFACIIIFLHISTALSFDVHISATDPGGTLLFNATNGKRWSYAVDRQPSRLALPYIELDSSTGVIFLKQSADCYKIRENPLKFRLISRTRFSSLASNYTVTPYSIFVHGSKCRFSHRTAKPYRLKYDSLHYIVVYSNTSKDECISRGQHILSLSEFLPISLRHCRIHVNVPMSSDFHVDKKSLIMTTLITRCFNGGELSVKFSVLCMCSDFETFFMPYQVLLHPVDHHKKVSHSRPQRFRRAVENSPPAFAKTDYLKHVQEEQRPGIMVATITATDTDLEDAGMLSYSMIPTQDERSQSMFAINPITGTINTTKTLDREFMAQHHFKIVAMDHGRPTRSGTTLLTVIVDDVNDHSPEFEKTRYSRNITENREIGYIVSTVRATDKDAGDNANIRYSFHDPGGQSSSFMIDPLGGTISTLADLDRETRSSYRLVVQAVDQGEVSSRRSTTTTVDIKILDENDNKPQFTEGDYTVRVSEDKDSQSRPIILEVNATDLDQGPNADIRYTLTGNTQEKFVIDSLTGKLRLVKPLDYEDQQEYHFTVRAEDNGRPSKKNNKNILVQVIDVNDNAPKFYADLYQESTPENAKVGTPILQVQASDADSGQNSELTYTVANAPESFPLVVDPKTGWIKTKNTLDRENVSVFRFNVVAKDNGRPPKSSSTSVVITVRDVNDNSPRFEKRVYEATISEEANVGSHVTTIKAIDKDDGDNAKVMYKITGGNVGSVFQISPNMGEGIVTLQKKLDARKQNRYILTVTATDTGGKVDTVEVFINVSDTNRHDPKFQGTPYAIAIDENLPVGTSVRKVLALDDDRGENAWVTYSIVPGTSAFAIDPNTGEITTRLRLDRESVQEYSFTVRATDNGKPSRSAEADIDVIVKDVNDNKPEFDKMVYEQAVKENVLIGRSVLQVTAIDRDKGVNGQVYYTFHGGNDGNGDFSIDSALGVIRVAKSLDRERIASYDLVAVAVDRGIKALSSSVTVKIRVEDVNDNRPQFESDEIDVKIAENSAIGSTVARISATDPDEGVNALVEYTFDGGADVDSFGLLNRKGEPAIIVTRVDLDYESDKKGYEVILRASSATLFSTVRVVIHVQDINDNAPELKDFTIIFNNFPQHFIVGSIGKVPAFDPDEYDRNWLVYKFKSGNEGNLLHLNESTGEITLDVRVNSDVPRSGNFEVSVSDGKNEVKAGCRLHVRLVTEDMLRNSVTIRLNKMTKTAFLSPLFKFFVDALASILHKEENNIFVINVRDDTDVSAQILNVSVSVREKIVNVRGSSRDVFYSPEYVREQIYLQRTHLANLSTLQVLPFDDNLCMREPCTNFEVCQTTLRFGSAAPFITSETMLFRPIHPVSGYRCVCPHGFTGMQQVNLCDVEVDLCYSKPCWNKGTCVRKESGYTCLCPENFTGEKCEISMTSKYNALRCPSHLCRPPSQCVPLIQGGFRCSGCPDEEHYDQYCRLTKRSFSKGSFLTFPSLKRRNRFTIQLKFATQEKNGLLFYNGRFNELHDFLALEIIDRQVHFSFSLGSNVTRVSPYIQGGVSDGEWHQVTLSYVNRQATVTVGENCDTLISVMYGEQLGNYTCAARETLELPKRCDKMTEICHRLFDLTGPLQIGGLPSLPTTFQIQSKDYVGCISDFYIDHELLDLNSSVSFTSKGTVAGCPAKQKKCLSAPCKHTGKCREGWNSFICDCTEKTGGKDCSQVIETSRQLRGNGYLSYSDLTLSSVRFPWFNGLSFRTRSLSGTLMQVILKSGEVIIELINGYITYSFKETKVEFDLAAVNDGKWHYFESRWHQGQLEMYLDYGQLRKVVEMPSTISNSRVEIVYVGGQRIGNDPISRMFIGCVKDIRVGNSGNSLLERPTETNVQPGCTSSNVCVHNPCGPGRCIDEWETLSCECPAGYIGPKCEEVCTNSNPCQNYAECRHPTGNEKSYTCECGKRQSGKYCENMAPKTCPAAWYGNPQCGPCNCAVNKGFEYACHPISGSCHCKKNHFRPVGSDTCFPCDCYKEGSSKDTCLPLTGQCKCYEGVTGRRCDQCSSIFAQIWNKTCVVVYKGCPKNHAEGIWWDPAAFGDSAKQDCPGDTEGEAVRECKARVGWQKPNLFNCTSVNFTKLLPQLAQIRLGVINTYVAATTIDNLKNATDTTKPMFGGDIMTTYIILREILKYENQLKGLSLTSEQHGTFIQKMLTAFSNVTKPEFDEMWETINKQAKGAPELMELFENYTVTLATSIASTKAPPFDSVSDNMVLGVDWISKSNKSHKVIPKYDNIPRKGIFDEDSNIQLPMSVFTSASGVTTNPAKVYIGYILYRTMGNILPDRYASSIKIEPGRPMAINSMVFTIVLVDEGHVVHGPIKDPVNVTLKQLTPSNNSSPLTQCVYWKPDHKRGGMWAGDRCQIIDRYIKGGQQYVVCSCLHLSTFALLMDVASSEYLLGAQILVEVLTYILIAVSLVCLVVCFFIFLIFKRLQSNWNSIHINLVLVIFIIQMAFVIGINQTDNKLFCKLISITLHYFYVSAFAWLFIEILHIYRMLTELRIINYGSMKFYYLVAYVLPGIVVGLSVGLYTAGYENRKFCWMSIFDSFIWSFAGPVIVAVVICIFTFILAMNASCQEKVREPENLNNLRVGLLCVIVLLLLLSISWVLGLISVNYRNKIFQYIFTVFMCSQGIFILLAHVLLNKKVRLQLKRAWYRCQGKKLEMDENLAGTRSTMLSRSALAYRHDSSTDGGLHRVNIGISTTSTTSRSSKSSGAYHKGDDYLRSTSSSTSGHVPSSTTYPPNTGIPPYGYDPSAFHDKGPDGTSEHYPDTGEVTHKPGNDSDSDSEVSIDRNSLDLASSHSSDEDDDFDIGPRWEQNIPKSKAVEQAREQLEKRKKERNKAKNNSADPHTGHWSGDGDHAAGSDMEMQPTNRTRLSNIQPDVTLPASERQGRDYIVPPVRSDSLQNNYAGSNTTAPDRSRPNRMRVQVLTHNGSVSSDTE